MVWFFVLLFAFVALFVRALWLAGKDPRVKARVEADEQVQQSAQHPPSTTTWQERVAGIEAAREEPAQPLYGRPANTLQVTVNGVEHDYTNHPLFQTIAPMMASGRWDEARRYLQKIAYGVKEASEQEQRDFKHLMMAFASADPLYAHCLRGITPILAEHPEGIRQTALYPHMAAAPDTETARYVLYYADALGAIDRQKNGNSYVVFAAGAGPKESLVTGHGVVPEAVQTALSHDVDGGEHTEPTWLALTQEPFYQEAITLVRQQLQTTPGILQSDLVKAAVDNADQLRHVLYAAEKAGHVRRVKKGRSYQLFLPE